MTMDAVKTFASALRQYLELPPVDAHQRMIDMTDDNVATPEYIEPILQAVKPYTLSGTRDSAAHVAWEIDKAVGAAGYAIVPKEPTKEMIDKAEDALEEHQDTDFDSPDGGSYTYYTSGAARDMYIAAIAAAGTQQAANPKAGSSPMRAMLELSGEQRLEVMGHFCRGCGCHDPEGRCQCENDE